MTPSHLPPAALLNEPLLDAAHERIFAALEQTRQVSQERFPAAYAALVAHIEADFRHEEELMERFQCADAHLHREQHARMLAGLHHAAADLLQGLDGSAQRALDTLADWLPFHIATQDRHLLATLREGGQQPARG